MRLELDNVPGPRRLAEADRDGIQRATEVATVGLDPPLAARSRDRPRGQSRRCPEVAAPSAPPPSDRSRTAAGCVPGSCAGVDPAEVVPERPLAGLADQRSAEMCAEAGIGVRLVGLKDRCAGRCRSRGQRDHQRASPSARRCASSNQAQVASSCRSRSTAIRQSFSASRRAGIDAMASPVRPARAAGDAERSWRGGTNGIDRLAGRLALQIGRCDLRPDGGDGVVDRSAGRALRRGSQAGGRFMVGSKGVVREIGQGLPRSGLLPMAGARTCSPCT